MYKFRFHRLVPVALVAILCSGLVATGNVQAEPGGGHREGFSHGPGDFGPHRLFGLLHDLDLNREQRTAIGAAMDKQRPLMREFMFDMMDGKKALNEILTSENYDPKQIETLAAAQAANAEKMFLATAKSFAEISAILTVEQRRQLAELMEKRHARWGGKHFHGGNS